MINKISDIGLYPQSTETTNDREKSEDRVTWMLFAPYSLPSRPW